MSTVKGKFYVFFLILWNFSSKLNNFNHYVFKLGVNNNNQNFNLKNILEGRMTESITVF